MSSTPWTTSRRDDDGGKTRELGVCLSFCEWILPRRSPNSNGAAKSGQKRCCRMLPSLQSVIQQIRSQSDDSSMKIDSRLASYSSRLGFVQRVLRPYSFFSLCLGTRFEVPASTHPGHQEPMCICHHRNPASGISPKTHPVPTLLGHSGCAAAHLSASFVSLSGIFSRDSRDSPCPVISAAAPVTRPSLRISLSHFQIRYRREASNPHPRRRL